MVLFFTEDKRHHSIGGRRNPSMLDPVQHAMGKSIQDLSDAA